MKKFLIITEFYFDRATKELRFSKKIIRVSSIFLIEDLETGRPEKIRSLFPEIENITGSCITLFKKDKKFLLFVRENIRTLEGLLNEK